MNYTFHQDESGRNCATFAVEDTLIAYWFETTFPDNTQLDDLKRLIGFCQGIKKGSIDDHQSSQHGYYLQANAQFVSLIALSTLIDPRTEQEKSDGKMDFENMSECRIELSEFIDMLIQWQSLLNQ